MAVVRYVKTVPRQRVRRPPLLSYVLMLLGAGILVWVGGPILSFWIFTSPYLSKSVTPLPDQTLSAPGVAEQVLSDSTGTVSKQAAAYANPDIWFPARPQSKEKTRITSYTITIPKLKIIDAKATVAGDDLTKSLIHYGGTALPGDYGNTVIFGHSTLVQLYNPKDYKTIFSLLPTLKKGDSIYVKSDGVQYRYVVYDMTVTDPNDVSALEQQFDGEYLTLITCVPPGTYLKRLNVKAKLERI